MSAPSYRPITDTWILARAKLTGGRRYYGAYPGGFPERARALLGVTLAEPVLHVCGGMARHYPYAGGFGPHDRTLDLAPETEPDYLQDAADPLPLTPEGRPWAAMLIDPPYTPEDAEQYAPGRAAFPSANRLLANALRAVRPGGRVGLLHYLWPQPPSETKAGFPVRSVAAVAVLVGFNNRVRLYSVFERGIGGK